MANAQEPIDQPTAAELAYLGGDMRGAIDRAVTHLEETYGEGRRGSAAYLAPDDEELRFSEGPEEPANILKLGGYYSVNTQEHGTKIFHVTISGDSLIAGQNETYNCAVVAEPWVNGVPMSPANSLKELSWVIANEWGKTNHDGATVVRGLIERGILPESVAIRLARLSTPTSTFDR